MLILFGIVIAYDHACFRVHQFIGRLLLVKCLQIFLCLPEIVGEFR